jgi:Kef-type K+ transport system membrane component KefB
MSHTSILIILLAFLTYGLRSKYLQSTELTGPMLFAVLGVLVGPAGADFVSLPISGSIIHTLAEITLILVLFSDAATIDFRQLRRDHNLPVRMLLRWASYDAEIGWRLGECRRPTAGVRAK